MVLKKNIFQIFDNSKAWRTLPIATKPDTKELVAQLIGSKATSTASRYIKEIQKFFIWCQSVKLKPVPPFSSALLLAYLSKSLKSSQSFSSLSLSYSALTWFHSLLPDNNLNPLDCSACHQLIKSAKRSKNPIKKKRPLTADMIKEIIDKHGSPSANRWKSVVAKDMYILEETEKRLSITSNLGI